MPSFTATALVDSLKSRFDANPLRHKGVAWDDVHAKLATNNKTVLRTLGEMERTGGEPDVIGFDQDTGVVTFCDCSAQSPSGRRSLCFDREALDARKQNKPSGCVTEIAAAMGVDLLTERQYWALQELGDFDTTTSSWIATPSDIRELSGALFCDRRYGKVFTYHNGAESYYAARGFRGLVRL